jgi:HEAT repeat protein
VPHLVRRLSDHRRYAGISYAARPLGEIGPAALWALLEAIDDPHTHVSPGGGVRLALVRRGAALALGIIGPPARRALPQLIRRLRDRDPGVRRLVVGALASIDPAGKTVLPPVRRTLADSEPDVRERAVEALAALSRTGADAARISDLLEDPDRDVRAAAVKALEGYGAAGLPGLIRALAAKDTGVRRGAANAIAGLDGAAAAPAVPALLEKGLADPDPHVRRISAHALGRIGRLARAALPALRALAADPSAEVRRVAARAVGRITRGSAPAGAP